MARGFELKFNINEYIHVQLNDEGRRIHRERFDELFRDALNPPEYRAPKECALGWSRFQMWELMQLFGPSIYLGGEPPFSTEIIIPQKEDGDG